MGDDVLADIGEEAATLQFSGTQLAVLQTCGEGVADVETQLMRVGARSYRRCRGEELRWRRSGGSGCSWKMLEEAGAHADEGD